MKFQIPTFSFHYRKSALFSLRKKGREEGRRGKKSDTIQNHPLSCPSSHYPRTTDEMNIHFLLPQRRSVRYTNPDLFYSLPTFALKRRQPKRIPAVLDPEHAEQEGVSAEDDAAPDEDGDLLGAGFGHAGDFEGQADGGEGEDAVCSELMVSGGVLLKIGWLRFSSCIACCVCLLVPVYSSVTPFSLEISRRTDNKRKSKNS